MFWKSQSLHLFKGAACNIIIQFILLAELLIYNIDKIVINISRLSIIINLLTRLVQHNLHLHVHVADHLKHTDIICFMYVHEPSVWWRRKCLHSAILWYISPCHQETPKFTFSRKVLIFTNTANLHVKSLNFHGKTLNFHVKTINFHGFDTNFHGIY